MKKIFRAILLTLMMCITLCCMFGCSEDAEVEGKYYLSGGSAQNGGPLCSLLHKDENGAYTNIIGGDFNPSDFWIELKDGQMTVHGAISPVVGGSVAYNVNADTVKTFKYKLKTSTKNEAWYSIYDGDEDTLYTVMKSGKTLAFEYGEQGPDFWYSINYVRTK
ncbi:MAG: hypothetical protein NC132_00360 [Corallococcus sp.]|nr:hypothetical protein [Corallococcus sp.]MCM1359176.1 hypothetical protein [Corallococcus sp.]MCM1394566.1 hypothetical protein [Corallococcus sp.]